LIAGLQLNIRVGRWLIGGGYAGVVSDLSLKGFFVQSLYISLFANLHGRVTVDLDEVVGTDDFSDPGPVLGQMRDKGSQGNDAVIEEKLDHLCDPPQILLPFLQTKAKAQIKTEPVTDIIAVEDISPFSHQVQVFYNGMSKDRHTGS